MGTRLFIGNLSYNVTEQELREAFTGDGIELRSVRVALDRETGRPRGFAFVETDDRRRREGVDREAVGPRAPGTFDHRRGSAGETGRATSRRLRRRRLVPAVLAARRGPAARRSRGSGRTSPRSRRPRRRTGRTSRPRRLWRPAAPGRRRPARQLRPPAWPGRLPRRAPWWPRPRRAAAQRARAAREEALHPSQARRAGTRQLAVGPQRRRRRSPQGDSVRRGAMRRERAREEVRAVGFGRSGNEGCADPRRRRRSLDSADDCQRAGTARSSGQPGRRRAERVRARVAHPTGCHRHHRVVAGARRLVVVGAAARAARVRAHADRLPAAARRHADRGRGRRIAAINGCASRSGWKISSGPSFWLLGEQPVDTATSASAETPRLHQRSVDPHKPSAGHRPLSALRGELDQISLSSVLTVLEMERKNGILMVEHVREAGRLFLRERPDHPRGDRRAGRCRARPPSTRC